MLKETKIGALESLAFNRIGELYSDQGVDINAYLGLKSEERIEAGKVGVVLSLINERSNALESKLDANERRLRDYRYQIEALREELTRYIEQRESPPQRRRPSDSEIWFRWIQTPTGFSLSIIILLLLALMGVNF
jgi:hypothetical protein